MGKKRGVCGFWCGISVVVWMPRIVLKCGIGFMLLAPSLGASPNSKDPLIESREFLVREDSRGGLKQSDEGSFESQSLLREGGGGEREGERGGERGYTVRTFKGPVCTWDERHTRRECISGAYAKKEEGGGKGTMEGSAFGPVTKAAVVNNLTPEQRFTATILLQAFPRLKCIVDLTNTERYYDKKEFTNVGVKHEKIMIPGKRVPPQNSVMK
uniref:Uncharacterized protein n=1 Tax=Vespula pensylvanica TaxID=30213 RepID=A0A834P3U7_VESPE|nr:hypothetical protein H0235_007014 [Vespula pensylvanica]